MADDETIESRATFYVDEAGDGVLFGPKGRNRLNDAGAQQFFMLLFKQQLHKHDHHRIVFARRGKSDRTEALEEQLRKTRRQHLTEQELEHETELEIVPAYPWEEPCLQIADYCLWALQRCYEKHEPRFLNAIWSKVSLVHDVDDPDGKSYGNYLTRKKAPPDLEKIKNRWI